MNATNRTRNGTMHAEFIAINEILSPSPSSTSNTTSPSPALSACRAESSPSSSSTTPEFPLAKNEESTEASTGKPYPFPPRILKESTLYVTVEPCIMCASLLRQFGIKQVFFGASNEKFGGTGGVLDIQRANGKVSASESELSAGHEQNEKGTSEGEETTKGDYEVSGGWLREEAIVMLRRFYVQENGRAPEPRRKADRVLKLEVEPLEGMGGA